MASLTAREPCRPGPSMREVRRCACPENDRSVLSRLARVRVPGLMSAAIRPGYPESPTPAQAGDRPGSSSGMRPAGPMDEGSVVGVSAFFRVSWWPGRPGLPPRRRRNHRGSPSREEAEEEGWLRQASSDTTGCHSIWFSIRAVVHREMRETPQVSRPRTTGDGGARVDEVGGPGV